MSEQEQTGSPSKEVNSQLPSRDALIRLRFPKNKVTLENAFKILDREGKFVLQLTLIFVFSMQVGDFVKQSLNQHTNSVKVSISDTKHLVPVKSALNPPVNKVKTITTALIPAKPLPHIQKRTQMAQAPVQSQTLSSSYAALKKSQAITRPTFWFKSQNKSIKPTIPSRRMAAKKADPIQAIRQVLKRDYQISKVSGSYEQHMKWVRKTLADYQKAS